MPSVKITERGAKTIRHNLAPMHTEGDVIEVSDSRARSLVSYGYALPVKDEKPEPDAPEHKPEETATDPNADERETRDESGDQGDANEKPEETPEPAPKRKPGRPRKNS